MRNVIKVLVICLLVSLVLFSCSKTDLNKPVPGCIEQMINDLKKKEVRNPPVSVWEWNVDGKTYYYITADCCDQYNVLYDENCNIVCAPDGGFTGGGDGNCPEFKGEILKTLIWSDPRK